MCQCTFTTTSRPSLHSVLSDKPIATNKDARELGNQVTFKLCYKTVSISTKECHTSVINPCRSFLTHSSCVDLGSSLSQGLHQAKAVSAHLVWYGHTAFHHRNTCLDLTYTPIHYADTNLLQSTSHSGHRCRGWPAGRVHCVHSCTQKGLDTTRVADKPRTSSSRTLSGSSSSRNTLYRDWMEPGQVVAGASICWLLRSAYAAEFTCT